MFTGNNLALLSNLLSAFDLPAFDLFFFFSSSVCGKFFRIPERHTHFWTLSGTHGETSSLRLSSDEGSALLELKYFTASVSEVKHTSLSLPLLFCLTVCLSVSLCRAGRCDLKSRSRLPRTFASIKYD